MPLARSARAAVQAGMSAGSATQAALDEINVNAPKFRAYTPTPLAPPTAACTAAQGGAGNVEVGTHSWKVTNVKDGTESEVGPVSNQLNVITVASVVNLSAVAAGPAGTTSRNIYRTVLGDTGSYKLVGSIADNVTTAFNDSIADASLGVVAPVGGQPEADTYQEYGRRGFL